MSTQRAKTAADSLHFTQGWGLSWSRRWHRLNPDFKHPRSLCGSPLYLPEKIRERKQPRHLLAIVDDPNRAPVCKKCTRYAP